MCLSNSYFIPHTCNVRAVGCGGVGGGRPETLQQKKAPFFTNSKSYNWTTCILKMRQKDIRAPYWHAGYCMAWCGFWQFSHWYIIQLWKNWKSTYPNLTRYKLMSLRQILNWFVWNAQAKLCGRGWHLNSISRRFFPVNSSCYVSEFWKKKFILQIIYSAIWNWVMIIFRREDKYSASKEFAEYILSQNWTKAKCGEDLVIFFSLDGNQVCVHEQL